MFLHSATADVLKAHDRVRHSAIPASAARRSVPQHYIHGYLTMARAEVTLICPDGRRTRPIRRTRGISRWCPAGGILYGWVMDDAIQRTYQRAETEGITLEAMMRDAPSGASRPYTAYVDDLILIATNRDNLQRLVELASEELAVAGLELAVEKFRWNATERSTEPPPRVNGKPVQHMPADAPLQVLGAQITPDGVEDAEVNASINRAWAACRRASRLLNNRRIPLMDRIRYFNATVVAAALCNMGNSCLTWDQQRRLDGCQRILVARRWRRSAGNQRRSGSSCT